MFHRPMKDETNFGDSLTLRLLWLASASLLASLRWLLAQNGQSVRFFVKQLN